MHVAELELDLQSARRLNAGLADRLCLDELQCGVEAVRQPSQVPNPPRLLRAAPTRLLPSQQI